MRTKGRAAGAPDADSPWSEIVPGLWMGGHQYRDSGGILRPVIVGTEFDVVVSLYQREGHGPAAGVEHHYEDLPDAPLLPSQLEAVCFMADIATRAVRSHQRVLIRCCAGYNRSGLVVAQTLVNLGRPTHEAILLIRRRRSEWALNNSLFVDYLNTGLDIARLLTELGA